MPSQGRTIYLCISEPEPRGLSFWTAWSISPYRWWDHIFKSFLSCFYLFHLAWLIAFLQLCLKDFTLSIRLRKLISQQVGRPLASKKPECLFLTSVWPKACVAWLVAHILWAKNQSRPSKTHLSHTWALIYPRPQHVTLLVDSKDRVVTSLHWSFEEALSLQLLMGVRRRKRTLERYNMLWHFKGDYFFFPSIM